MIDGKMVLRAIEAAIAGVKQKHPIIPTENGSSSIDVLVPQKFQTALGLALGVGKPKLGRGSLGTGFLSDVQCFEETIYGCKLHFIEGGRISVRYIYGRNQVTEVEIILDAC